MQKRPLLPPQTHTLPITNRHRTCLSPAVVNVRFQPGDQPPAAANRPGLGCVPGGRLNLLLSYGGWRPESWVDSLPRLLAPMGVISHRADTGREATQVIRSVPIHIAIVDLGLPLDRSARQAANTENASHTEEGGARLLELLFRLPEPPPTVVVKRSRTHRDDCREIAAALRAGAFAVMDRPTENHDLETMLEVLRRCLVRFYQGRWPGTA